MNEAHFEITFDEGYQPTSRLLFFTTETRHVGQMQGDKHELLNIFAYIASRFVLTGEIEPFEVLGACVAGVEHGLKESGVEA